MRKLQLSVVAACGAFALTGATGALAASGGDPNAGDVWVDTYTAPSGPGHEMDPHLPCQNINLWGAGLADSGGSYAIDGWPPSGSQEVDYSSTWKYDQSTGGSQVIDTINVQQLIANAAANGDSPAHNGYHFKLDFSQDPQKHKTFWIDCPAPSSSPSSSSSTSSSSTPSSPPSSPPASSTAPASTPTSSTAPSSTSTTSTQNGTVKATHKSRKTRARKHKKHKALVKPHRVHRAPHQSVKAVSTTAPAFTG